MNLSHGQQVLEVRIKSSLFFFLKMVDFRGHHVCRENHFHEIIEFKFFDYKLFNLRLKILFCEF